MVLRVSIDEVHFGAKTHLLGWPTRAFVAQAAPFYLVSVREHIESCELFVI